MGVHAHRIDAVSYTHLDVYKRQGLNAVTTTYAMRVDADTTSPCLLYTSSKPVRPRRLERSTLVVGLGRYLSPGEAPRGERDRSRLLRGALERAPNCVQRLQNGVTGGATRNGSGTAGAI